MTHFTLKLVMLVISIPYNYIEANILLLYTAHTCLKGATVYSILTAGRDLLTSYCSSKQHIKHTYTYPIQKNKTETIDINLSSLFHVKHIYFKSETFNAILNDSPTPIYSSATKQT